MADTAVYTAGDGGTDLKNGMWGPYWISTTVGLIIHMEAGGNLRRARTTDGASWVSSQIDGGGSVKHVAAWFDQETPGDAGTLVHVAWYQGNEVNYQTVDISDNSLGTLRVVDNTVTEGAAGTNRLAIAKAPSGDLMIAGSTQTEIFCYLSDDGGVTWGAVAEMFETATEEDFLKLYPADVDPGDFAGLFWDRSASEFSLKLFDKSANTITETAIAGSMVADAVHYNFDAAVRHSDNHLLLAAHSNDNDAGDDLRTWDLAVDSIAAPTVTAKTNIFTNQGASAQVGVLINQQNDDWYVAYLKGGTWLDTVDVVYHLSTDGGASWGAEQAYSEAAADDLRLVHAGRTVGDGGGFFQPVWFNDDLSDYFVNLVNDVAITVAGGGVSIPVLSDEGVHSAVFGGLVIR